MKKPLKAICYGEILWDVFPDGKTLGGAPLNVALRLQSLDAKVKMISKLGSDNLAEETLNSLADFNFDTSLIQTDKELETGAVLVTLDKGGSASYEIKEPVAWDAIVLTPENKKAVSETDMFIFGSLAARSKTSKITLLALLEFAKYAVFDVNFRKPHYDLQEVLELMNKAQFVKMNEEELEEICSFLDYKNSSFEKNLAFLSKQTNTDTLCVTRGDAGAVLYQNSKLFTHPGYPVKVVDTVGAGDSFLAGLLFQLIKQQNPEKALAFACALGSLVASKKGANARISEEEIAQKMA